MVARQDEVRSIVVGCCDPKRIGISGQRSMKDPPIGVEGVPLEDVNGSMKSQLAWARAKGFFYGERNSVIEEGDAMVVPYRSRVPIMVFNSIRLDGVGDQLAPIRLSVNVEAALS